LKQESRDFSHERFNAKGIIMLGTIGFDVYQYLILFLIDKKTSL